MSEIKSEIIPIDGVGESYGELEEIKIKKLQIYRIFYDKKVDLEFFDGISTSKEILSKCFFSSEANWINSTHESGYFYEIFIGGDSNLVKMLFQEFIKNKNIKATLEKSPANELIVGDIMQLVEDLKTSIPELYYFEDGEYKGIPFLLSIEILNADAESFTIDSILPKKIMLGWWNTNKATIELEIDKKEKIINSIPFRNKNN